MHAVLFTNKTMSNSKILNNARGTINSLTKEQKEQLRKMFESHPAHVPEFAMGRRYRWYLEHKDELS